MDYDLTISVGTRLRKAREDIGMSQVELANKIGVHRSTICLYENDKRSIPMNLVAKMASILEIDPAVLIGWSDEPTNIMEGATPVHDGLSNILVSYINKMTELQKAELLAHVIKIVG